MNVVMPQMGETVTEGTITAWHVKIGDRVELDDLLLDIETDKAATEIPAPIAGTVEEILVTEGQTVGVGTVLAVINPEPAGTGEAEYEDITEIPPPAAELTAPTAGPPSDEAPLSPAVRRLVAEHGLSSSMIKGTGRGGRIKRSDVMEYLQNLERESAATALPVEEQVEDTSLIPSGQVAVEHSVTPQVLQAMEVDFTNVAKIRAKHGASWREKTGYSLTYLPFIARAVCLAIGDFPHINAGLEEDGLKLHPHVNLAIAVDLGGEWPVAPVLKGAERFTVARFADRIHGLTMKARKGILTDADLGGGTYTISNSGTFGTLFTAPFINPPQVASLSSDVISKRPVVTGGPDGDSFEIRYIGILSQSFDRRAIDWAYSAAFLRRVKSIIEESDWLGKLI